MKLVAIPTYRDIFKEEPPEVGSLLKDIPSKVIISVLSALNANIFLKPQNQSTQIEIYQFITARFSKEQKDLIWKGIYPSIKSANGDFALFNTWYITEFIQNELLNFREFDLIDTSPEQEYNIFKSYLIFAEKLNDKHSKVFTQINTNEKNDLLKFQQLTWPLLIGQFDFNHNINPVYQVIRTFTLFNYLKNNIKTKVYADNFLSIVNKKNFELYISDLMELIKISQKESGTRKFKNFSITSSDDFENILDSLSVDIEVFKKDKVKHIDYKGLREKPILKISKNNFIVMNWSFLYNQLYLGFLFDFYSRSGIDTLYKEFSIFKGIVGKEVSEDLIFKKIFTKLFTKKYGSLVFAHQKLGGLPDCYFRIGKNIFLFEFKDYLMPSNVINSQNFELIKAEIDKKFIKNEKGKSKGINQILEQIKCLNNNSFEFDKFEKKGIKQRNIVVYPVIVYTHFMFSMPGINDYLKKELKDLIDKKNISIKVRDLVMIGFDFFYLNFLELSEDKINFKNILDNYNTTLKKSNEKFLKEFTPDNFLKAHASFEECQFNTPSKHKENIKNGYIQKLFETLGVFLESAEDEKILEN